MNKSHLKLKALVALERKTLTEILTHLKIINDQKVFTQMGYKSLLHYCVKELGYSESAAYRRISALRLEKKIPEVKKAITSGEINLSTITKLNGLLDQKQKEDKIKITTMQKRNLLSLVRNKSTKLAETIIRKELKLPIKKRILKIEMSEDSYQQWVEFKGKHIAKAMTDEMLLVFAMREVTKEKQIRRYRHAKPQRSSNPRYISAKTKRDIRKAAKGKCQFQYCESTFALEIDHIIPVSKGGRGNIENLQLLCRHHNALKSNRMKDDSIYSLPV